MIKELIPAFRATLLLTIVTGLVYPGAVTGVCRVLFPHQADGSLVTVDGRIVGSSLLGQNFSKPEYFHPRPSAAGTDGYDATASTGSNYGPTSQKLYDRVKASVAQFRKDNPAFTGAIPADAVTASGSGLDPEISTANALAQSARVAKARNTSSETVTSLVASSTEGRDLGLFGEPRVNVLRLNLLLDQQFAKK